MPGFVLVLSREPDRRGDWKLLLAYLAASQSLSISRQSFCSLPRYSDVARHVRMIAETDLEEDFGRVGATLELLLDTSQPVTVLIDGMIPSELNPLLGASWEALVARLILGYPEVRFLCSRTEPEFAKLHGLANLFRPTIEPLFDGSGLRDHVRKRAGKSASATTTVTTVEKGRTEEPLSGAPYLARRKRIAIALDEEVAYSHLHAYAAYRFGFRAVPVQSAALADDLLHVPRSPATTSDCAGRSKAPPDLVLEDIYLNFADGRPGMSDLANKRHSAWESLEKAKHRIFVTSGYHDEPAKSAKNRAYIAEQKASLTTEGERRHIRVLHKPYAGIFRLWQGSGLARAICWTDEHGKTHRGVAEGFIWPPRKESFSTEGHGHSSPGVLMVIADSLIKRAKKLLPDVISVEQAVRGAVLANDALELLGCRTPTLAVEALRLKHRFEVLAECHFSGVEHHIQLKERLDEIRRDVAAISQWFGRKQRETAALNAEMQILLNLVHVFRDNGQFDEEHICMARVRQIHHTLWMRESSSGFALPWRMVFWPFFRYVEGLLASFPFFVLSLIAWSVIIAALFNLTHYGNVAEATFNTFFGFGWPSEEANVSRWVAGLAMLAGIGHLGIFVSHLYTIVSRR